MEEYIKILEESLKAKLFFTDEYYKSLENLLTKYKQLEQENNNFKEASIINDRLYKEVCNKNKELEEEIDDLKNDLYHDGLAHKYLTLKATSIPKSLIKEKIEELKKQYEDYLSKWEKSGKDKAHPFYRYLVRIEAEIDILQELLRRGEVRCVNVVKK